MWHNGELFFGADAPREDIGGGRRRFLLRPPVGSVVSPPGRHLEVELKKVDLIFNPGSVSIPNVRRTWDKNQTRARSMLPGMSTGR